MDRKERQYYAKTKKKACPDPESFETLEDFWGFWDDRSLADYEALLKPVECRINLIRRTRLVAVEPNLLKDIAAYAKSRGISCETLINLWLQERLGRRSAKAKAA